MREATGTETESAVEVVDRLLRDARACGASDVHLDPGCDGTTVRMRRDGVLQTTGVLDGVPNPHLVGRCKALADLLVYRQDLPQEGRIAGDRAGLDCDVRVATYPTLFGERVALRLDAPDGAPRELTDLDLDPSVCGALTHAIEEQGGVVLLTGPSGSGKTTTLYSCLHHLTTLGFERSIVTVEDPVERVLPGVVQTEVRPSVGLDFPRALRSLLRQDPEVILVGEIRDRETAAIAFEAGLTGHLVVSTVHAGTAPEVFTRLLEMGVEPFVLTTTVRGVLAQRLLRRVCRHGGNDDETNCATCSGVGYAGRQLVAEWLTMTSELRDAVLARGDGVRLDAAARAGGYETLRDAAQRLVADGWTDQQEVERVLGRDGDR